MRTFADIFAEIAPLIPDFQDFSEGDATASWKLTPDVELTPEGRIKPAPAKLLFSEKLVSLLLDANRSERAARDLPAPLTLSCLIDVLARKFNRSHKTEEDTKSRFVTGYGLISDVTAFFDAADDQRTRACSLQGPATAPKATNYIPDAVIVRADDREVTVEYKKVSVFCSHIYDDGKLPKHSVIDHVQARCGGPSSDNPEWQEKEDGTRSIMLKVALDVCNRNEDDPGWAVIDCSKYMTLVYCWSQDSTNYAVFSKVIDCTEDAGTWAFTLWSLCYGNLEGENLRNFRREVASGKRPMADDAEQQKRPSDRKREE